MNKSMYSLMLMDKVVNEIDRIAYEKNTNRSNLINQILAEYVSITTPELKAQEILDSIANRIAGTSSFQVQNPSSDFMVSIKSAIQYKYRPTIRYAVELYRTDNREIGEIRISFRTQNKTLLLKLEEFLKVLIKIERSYFSALNRSEEIVYSIEENGLKRTFVLPKSNELDNKEISRAIADYIKAFDRLIKGYLLNEYITDKDMERAYQQYIKKTKTII